VHVALIDPSRVVLKIVAGMLEAGGHTVVAVVARARHHQDGEGAALVDQRPQRPAQLEPAERLDRPDRSEPRRPQDRRRHARGRRPHRRGVLELRRGAGPGLPAGRAAMRRGGFVARRVHPARDLARHGVVRHAVGCLLVEARDGPVGRITVSIGLAFGMPRAGGESSPPRRATRSPGRRALADRAPASATSTRSPPSCPWRSGELRRRNAAEAELALLSRTDPLTGLPNRRAFDARTTRPIPIAFVRQPASISRVESATLR
jgi:hypothetical protein